MKAQGFVFLLSEEDTGTGVEIHKNSSATEWFVAIYKPSRLLLAPGLPHGFLAADRSDNPDYERVPYSFPFRTGNIGLVLISVHLQLGARASDRSRRAHEIAAISSWISSRPGTERDYIIFGDMNPEDCDDLASVLPLNYASLNDQCVPTNTNVNGPKSYDHVMYHEMHSAQEIDVGHGMAVIDLNMEMPGRWLAALGPYPGEPYNHNAFRKYFSDHNPVAFVIRTDGPDDD